jgi:uncharacterized SAM-binding protein YcdF (DUF218 family)
MAGWLASLTSSAAARCLGAVKSTRIRRWLRGVGILTLVVALWLGVVAGWIVAFGESDHARPSDCAIVLGAAAYGSKPSPVFAERINHAVALYQSGTVKHLLFTGGSVIEADQSESAVARNHAIAAGVPEAAILTESQSRTTAQNLVQAKGVMDHHGLKTAVIVSDPLHLKRAASMAAGLGINAVTSPTPTSRYRTWKVKAGFLVREVFYLHGYWFTGK